MSKKRTTHGPIIRKETVAPSSSSSPEKNRFRIYFASPVEDADGPSLKALHAMETVDEDNAEEEQHDEDEDEADDDHEEQEQEAEEEDEEHGGEGDEEGQEEYYEAEGQDGGEAQGEQQDRDQADEQQKAEEVEAKDDSAAENQAEGDMSGVVEEDDDDEVNKPADESGVEPGEIAEIPLEAEEPKEQDVTMRDPSVPPQVESDSTAVVKDDTPAEKAVESTEAVSAAPADPPAPAPAPVEAESSKPTEPAANTPAESSSRVPSPTKKDRQKQSAVVPLAPREPSSHRIADARFRRSPSLPATSSDTPRPESNRLSILYANGKRRICLDSAIVESVKIHRKKGSIQVTLDAGAVKRKWEQDKQVEQIVKRIKETEVADDEVGEKGEEEKDGEKIEVEGKIKGDEKIAKDVVTKEDAKPEEWSLTKGILVSPASVFAVAYHSRRHGSTLLLRRRSKPWTKSTTSLDR